MLKRSLFIFSLFLNTLLFSQSIHKDFQINWDALKLLNQTYSQQIPIFSFYQAVYNGQHGLLPYFRFDIEIEEDVKDISIQINNQQYKLASVASYVDLHPAFNNISDEILIKTIFKKLKTKKIARIEFIPIKRNSILNAFSLLTSFRLDIELFKSIDKKSLKEFSFAEESIMAIGDWYKFRVDKSGVFKISGADLQNAGISISNLDPDKIAVFGFGGMLKERNSDFRFPDIPELAIEVVDGNDGKFDATDYLLFYAQGPDIWEYNSAKGIFEHQLNIYDRNAYYYVHIGNQTGKRMEVLSQPTEVANFQMEAYTDYAFIENETYNLIGSGRRWVGDKFEFIDSNKYNFNFENLVSGSTAYLKAELVARSTANSSFDLLYNGQNIGNVSISKIPTGSYPAFAYDNTFEKYFQLTTDPAISIDLIFNRPQSNSVGWLDYLEINVKRNLIFGEDQLAFRCSETVGEGIITQFSIENAGTNVLLWDITDFIDVESIQLNSDGIDAEFKVSTDKLREFVAFTPELVYSVEFVEKISNQNLHSISNVDMLIVCPQQFMSQANELADFHRQDGLNIQVSTLDQIYNEFSSGSQDVSAIRDYVRSVYMHSSEISPLRYLLLFGDASYDYMNRELINTNIIPTFESIESFDPIISIAVDDYFGFLDAGEGDLYYDDVDIGIGRLPVVTAEEASQAVAKIKHYVSSNSAVLGDWRNILCFVADDEDNNLHIRQADDLARMVDAIFPEGNLDKIYVDAFPQVSTPAGQRYPKVNDAINERIDQGALIVSYTGHGGETGWGQERFLDMPDVENWSNKDKLPVFLTATCEFARFDDPNRVSAGEHIFLNKNGGGIALYTTSRATYAGSNFVISRNFFNYTLNHPDHNYLRMGDILKLTKRASGSGFNVMKFVLLGDPALKLSIPENFAHITMINESAVNQENDTLKALSFVHIQGQINDITGTKLNNFNGHIYPLVFDKPLKITSLANDQGSDPFSFNLQKNVLYKGKAEVKDGDFEFSFVVPKDIAYNFGNGKFSLFASSDDSDAGGYNREIVIGGFDETNQLDTEGPSIELFL
ncbi:MAG: type IX secretion system sortase PorU, partial [Bacteroidales bacterium]|nr:type IX secretion system sortase PorU [Bacteroidales bacterium]